MMDTWINQGGYPLVQVGDDGALTQEPFSYQGEPGRCHRLDWQVPVLDPALDGDDDDPLAPCC